MSTHADAGAPSSAAAAAVAVPPAESGQAAHPVRRQLEENRLKNQVKRRAWEAAKERSTFVCAGYVGDFVKCTNDRTFSVIWACRAQNSVMTKCMKTYMETNDEAASVAAAEKLRDEYAKA